MARKRRRKKVTAPSVRRRRKTRARRRRRSNPVPVMFANPRRKVRRRRRRRAHAVAAPRRRRRRRVSASPRRRRRMYSNPRRRRLRRRRSNPGGLRLGKWGHVLKVAAFGGLGIVTARVGAHVYDQFLSSTVEGGNATGVRGWLGKVVRLASMGVLVVAGDKALAAARVAPINRTAFKLAGFGEAGRQAIGMAMKGVSQPAYNALGPWGLNGPDPRMAAAYGLDGPGSGYYGQLSPGSFGDLEDADSFLGDDDAPGNLEDIDSFDGSGRMARTAYSSPFAYSY